MKFDKNKTYTLRRGNEYRNYCDDAGKKYTLHGAYKTSNGEWECIIHTADGFYELEKTECAYDLIEVKKAHTITFWVNYYSNGEVSAFENRADADFIAGPNRLTCLEITRTFTEGDGL